jgi:hypothetical protein
MVFEIFKLDELQQEKDNNLTDTLSVQNRGNNNQKRISNEDTKNSFLFIFKFRFFTKTTIIKLIMVFNFMKNSSSLGENNTLKLLSFSIICKILLIQ